MVTSRRKTFFWKRQPRLKKHFQFEISSANSGRGSLRFKNLVEHLTDSKLWWIVAPLPPISLIQLNYIAYGEYDCCSVSLRILTIFLMSIKVIGGSRHEEYLEFIRKELVQ